jgi:hypothetical protein
MKHDMASAWRKTCGPGEFPEGCAMNIKPYILATAVTVVMSQADLAKAETPTARQDFINLCADCHNADAKGNGPLTKNLTKTPRSDAHQAASSRNIR